jgi:hypothetical protein
MLCNFFFKWYKSFGDLAVEKNIDRPKHSILTRFFSFPPPPFPPVVIEIDTCEFQGHQLKSKKKEKSSKTQTNCELLKEQIEAIMSVLLGSA